MKSAPGLEDLDRLWSRHNALWRDPAQIVSHWEEAVQVDADLLRHTARGAWWEVLREARVTLLVTREYEHLLMALRCDERGPAVSYLKLPHPSGVAFDGGRGMVHVACTRNPNQVIDLMPVGGLVPRADVDVDEAAVTGGRPLVPIRSRFFPGCLYMHDLALIGGCLHANSVGQNAVVRLDEAGRDERVWWPRAVERGGRRAFEKNYLQLNSIAAGRDLSSSFFSASTDRISTRRPGHKNFPVDGRGVIFSGETREPVARGLTRPHSARLHGGRVWVDNSGYGELGFVENGGFRAVVGLPGWTRGLCFRRGLAFVGTSRVIPRFRQYAPGLDVEKSVCGLHAVEVATGRVLGSLVWPYGNQIFALEWAPGHFTSGFPFRSGRRRAAESARKLFYAFRVNIPRPKAKNV